MISLSPSGPPAEAVRVELTRPVRARSFSRRVPSPIGWRFPSDRQPPWKDLHLRPRVQSPPCCCYTTRENRHPSPRPPPRNGEGEQVGLPPSPLRGGGRGEGFWNGPLRNGRAGMAGLEPATRRLTVSLLSH